LINYYYTRSSGTRGRRLPLGNPLANALVVLAGTLVIVASVILGFIALVAVGSLVLVLAAIIGIRLWWLNRKLTRRGRGRDAGTHASGERVRVHVIEGEYRDLSGSRGSRRS
jgi:hypothetical protein